MQEWCPRCQQLRGLRSEYESIEKEGDDGKPKTVDITHHKCVVCGQSISSVETP